MRALAVSDTSCVHSPLINTSTKNKASLSGRVHIILSLSARAPFTLSFFHALCNTPHTLFWAPSGGCPFVHEEGGGGLRHSAYHAHTQHSFLSGDGLKKVFLVTWRRRPVGRRARICTHMEDGRRARAIMTISYFLTFLFKCLKNYTLVHTRIKYLTRHESETSDSCAVTRMYPNHQKPAFSCSLTHQSYC